MREAILVGIDGSIASRAAITWAIERVRGIRAAISMLFVVDDEWGTISDRDLVELRSSAELIAARELEFAREKAESTAVTVGVAVGNPMLTLAGEASNFMMIAIGTHKVGAFHGHALGSRSLQLAAMSAVPTAVIPISAPHGRSGVAVGVGDAPGWLEPVRFAAVEAARLGEELTLVRSGAPTLASDDGVLRLVAELLGAAELTCGFSLRRSASTAGESLAAISGRAVFTVSGRPSVPAAGGCRPLGRTNSAVLMNAGGPVIIVPHSIEPPWPTRAAAPSSAKPPFRESHGAVEEAAMGGASPRDLRPTERGGAAGDSVHD